MYSVCHQYSFFFEVAKFALTQNVHRIIKADTDVQITIELISGILSFNIDIMVETANPGTATGKATIIIFTVF